MTDHKIRLSGNLLTPDGLIREAGYALQPPFIYNREDVGCPHIRIKDWDYYLVQDEQYAVSLTFSDLGFIGLCCICVMDYTNFTATTVKEVIPLTMGRLNIPTSSDVGDIHWKNHRCSVDLSHPAKGVRRLGFSMKHFEGKRDFECEVLMDREPRDTMNIVRPWKEDEHAFYYNRKILGMRVKGAFRVGELYHDFDTDKAFGLLDWGRGVWTYQNTWYWAEIQGYLDGHILGINLGYGFGDESIATENMIFYDGVCHKLDRVDFGIPSDEKGRYIYTEPWHVHDMAGRLDLSFQTQIDRHLSMNMGVMATRQHQLFGICSGTAVLDDGTVLELNDVRMSAEHIYNRY